MHFFQSRYVYSMLSLNRKNTVTNYVEDLLKQNLLDLEDINSGISAKFKTKRKKMSQIQKQMCDELELF